MLDRSSLMELSRYRNEGEPVLSLYLAVDQDSTEDKHLLALKNLLNEVEGQRGEYDEEVWARVAANLERVRQWVRDGDARSGQGVAIFASGEDLWQPFVVPYPLPTAIHLDDHARLHPLFRLLQRFEQYLAILSDARDASLFVVTPDGTRPLARVEDDTPGRHDQGGWSQARFQRQQDRRVEEHLEHAAERAFRLFQRHGFDGVVLLGTDERTHQLEEELHPYLRPRVLAQLPMAMEASAQEIGEAVLELARERRRERQREQLEALKGHVRGASGRGVAGLEATLDAGQQGQIMALFMDEGFHAGGGKCGQCGVLTVRTEGACDYCGGPVRLMADMAEVLTSMALSQDAELIFLANEDGPQLGDHGGVGALLRYSPTLGDDTTAYE